MNIDAIIKELTLQQKAALLQGWTQWTTMPIPRLGIPELFMADGPHGVCKQTVTDKILWSRDTVPSTCFPPPPPWQTPGMWRWAKNLAKLSDAKPQQQTFTFFSVPV